MRMINSYLAYIHMRHTSYPFALHSGCRRCLSEARQPDPEILKSFHKKLTGLSLCPDGPGTLTGQHIYEDV